MPRPKLLASGALFLFFFVSLSRNLLEYRRNVVFHENFQSDYEAESYRNQMLKTQILKENDTYEIEKTIRNDLNLGKEGEIVVLVPSPTPTPTVYITPTLPVYKEWGRVFFQR